MKLLDHVYAIKNLLANGPASDDFSISDRLIAHQLKITRARLTEQKIDKYHFISEQSYQDLCVDLIEGNYHDCCDGPVLDCTILKSSIELPKFLNSRWGNHLKVTDLTGRTIREFNLTQQRYSKYALSPVEEGWLLHNNRLFVLNNKDLTKILVNALFNDPEEIANINCTQDATNCTGYLEAEFPIDSDLIDAMYDLTLRKLLNTIGIPQDLENDARTTQFSPK